MHKKTFRVYVTTFLLVFTFFPLQSGQAKSHFIQLNTTSDFESAPCMFTLPAGISEGMDVLCGYVSVPEDHAQPDGPRIKLAVAILKGKNAGTHTDPIFMLQGGPGGSTIDSFTSLLLGQANRLNTDRDIILFDQRGTYYSKPSLICTEVQDLTLKTLDVVLSSAESEKQYLQAIQSCRDRLTRQGINLSAYNSLENAADVESVRIALGYDKINLYGVSYGTLLALHTMKLFPNSLRSVTLDSVVPAQKNFLLDSPHSEDRVFTVFFNGCKADPECSRAYPNLEKTFFALVDQYNKKPMQITVTDPDNQTKYPAQLTGDDLQGTLYQLLYSTEIIPLLPRLIMDIQEGNYAILERFESLIVFDRTMSYGMYYSVLCAEENNFQLNEYNLQGIRPQIQESEANSVSDFQKTCQIWGVSSLGSSVNQPVSSDIPTLVLSGEYDPITPPDYGAAAAKTLSHSYSVVFPTGGHGAVTSGDCQNQVFLQFINDPGKAPDTSCIAAHPKVEFYTPKNILFLPSLFSVLNMDIQSMVGLVFLGLSVLACLSCLFVYPLAWLVRKIKRKTYPQIPSSQKVLPWVILLNGLVLSAFLISFAAIGLKMAMDNDVRIMLGLPQVYAPLFILPVIATIFTGISFVGTMIAWVKGYRSILRRVYDTFIVLAALTAVAILFQWGTVTVLFFNH